MQAPSATASTNLNAAGTRWGWFAALFLFAIAAFLRFSGITSLTLADDEYYVVRSVENILRSGLPEYLCGGFYPRGLLFQYSTAALTLVGTQLEFAPRMLAATSSLLALPAAFMVARRAGGPLAGTLALGWLALSLWQVDGAQFGRMYAPFQAVFCWYLWFYLRLTIDRDRRATLPLLLLTVLGIMIWEGGVLLAFTNLLAPFADERKGRLEPRDALILVVSAVIGTAAFLFATTDFRNLDPALVYPAGIDAIDTEINPGWQEVSKMASPLKSADWGWLFASLLPLGATALALRWLWRDLRDRWMTAVGLACALLATAAHQFASAGLIVALLVALGLLRWRELGTVAARPYVLAVALWFAGWLAYATFAATWLDGGDTSIISRVPMLTAAYSLVRFPDFLLEIVVPWSRAAPRLGILLAAATAVTILIAGMRRARLDPNLRVMLFLFLVLLGAAAASDPPRHETRYVFFLYPVAIIMLVALVVRASRSLSQARHAAVAAALSTILLFAFTEDTGVRERMGPALAQAVPAILAPAAGRGHLVGRTDNRGAAAWLAANAQPHQDFIVNASPGVDFYYRDFDSAYIDWTQQRFLAYSCDRGTRERWGNLPLIYRGEDLQHSVDSHDRSLVIATTAQATELSRGALARFSPSVVFESTDGRLQVLEIRRKGS